MNFKYFLTILTSLIETFVIGTIIYGWSSMNYILTELGYFNSSCNSSMINSKNESFRRKLLCPTQQYNLQLIFTIALLLALVLFAVSGYIMDYFGTWTLRIISCLSIIFSCIAIAFSNYKTSWILYPGFLLLSFGGQNLFFSNFQTANLLPKRRGLITNLVNAASEVSLVVFTFAKISFDHGVSFTAICLFFSFLGLLSLLRTFFLMPKLKIPYNLPNDYYYGIKECCSNNAQLHDSEAEQLLEQTTTETGNTQTLKETKNLKSCIFNSFYLVGVFSFAIQNLRSNFFIEELDSWLFHLLCGKKSLYSSYLNAFGFTQFTSIILALINGVLFDYVLQYFKSKPSLTSTQANLRAQSVVCFIGSSISITYSAFALLQVPSLQYVSFILFVEAEVIVWSNIILLILHNFPMKHFGILFGLAACIAAITSILQFPLLYVAIYYFSGSFFVVNTIVLVLCIFTLVHPINLYRCSKNPCNL